MEKSKWKSFYKRAITTIVLAPAAVGCLLSGENVVELLALAVAALLAWEWAKMQKSTDAAFLALYYLLASAVAIMFDAVWLIAGVIVGLSAVAYVLKRREKELLLKLLGIPYIAIGIGSIMALYREYGVNIVLWYVALVWAVDIGGYLFGSTLKGPKLAPRISPNKTWAGLFGGMLLAVLVSVGALWCAGEIKYVANAVILAAILTVIAQIGDLIESAIKRHLGLKDSSNLIPGHGGVFDRVDGLIFAAPFAYGLLMLLKLHF
ncbi:MAG: phosphatidate cytidylyltransferase [Alphaproteobacteria bacterium]|nr:phosphatidate cytidylyltransferase [Alphaproteobacteria bacterium]MBQ9234859.1 phosphatidate cytidylyltransferase [Alphaproteobacteria bacterium]